MELKDKTRIKLKPHFPALAIVICLQRKVWYGWKTVAWIYPSIMKDSSCKEILSYLEVGGKGKRQKSKMKIKLVKK